MILFVLGVIMAMLGLAFLVLKDFRLSSTIRFKRWQSVTLGILLLLYFPIYFALFPFIKDVKAEYRILTNWGIMAFSLLLTTLFLLLFHWGNQAEKQPRRKRTLPSKIDPKSPVSEQPENSPDIS